MTAQTHVTLVGAGVILLEMDNPPMNPCGPDMRDTMMSALDRVDEDDSLRCLVITGRGRAFCSGADLKGEMHKPGSATFADIVPRIEGSRVPVIAAVNGWAVGAGLELALCCDIRLASTEARFVCAGVNMGLMASAYRLPRLIGMSRAKTMLLTGLPYDGETAERFGLTTGLFEPEALMPAALEMAQRIASRAPLSTEATKRVSSRALDQSPTESEALAGPYRETLKKSNDYREAVAAFRERREPVFTRS